MNIIKDNTQAMYDAETNFNLLMTPERLSKFLVHYEAFKNHRENLIKMKDNIILNKHISDKAVIDISKTTLKPTRFLTLQKDGQLDVTMQQGNGVSFNDNIINTFTEDNTIFNKHMSR